MSVQLNIDDGHAITLDELLGALPRSEAAKEVAQLRGLVDHVLQQFDRMHAGDLTESDMDALAWEKKARALVRPNEDPHLLAEQERMEEEAEGDADVARYEEPKK